MSRGELIKIIDSCRDILIGKIPDPITQVDQITIALIYKFMNDMDQEAIDMGGEASFFANDFEKYNWKNILNTRHSAQEMLNLYSEGLTRIKENKNVPQLFKDILKEAYLPYNDPRILSLFLKEINKISYDDSESLGEAFEYLLSIMGSQGDAGQFRTPRHIIDFIVNIIKPQKSESILDPACGTAGFLISAFKYIQKENDYKLSSIEKETLSNNLVGYDIAPKMEMLSKVNLYLHKLSNPKIYQYDTLSSEGFWEDKYNIILANPPFMTPKGGISPHNKFSLKSNRSEVLFCDYINLHLKQNGRAGFIVPEGIIFKSDKAYKQLRKTLIEESLIAVISLPAGIFNPYSGVKTDILILDKKLHKETDKVLFLIINNDGYSLGAQRKPINENDLPESLQIFELFRQSIENHNYSKLEELNNKNVLLVDRETVLKNENCDLSVNRYKKEEKVNSKWEMVELGEVCDILNGYAFESKKLSNNKNDKNDMPIIKIGNLTESNEINFNNIQYHKYSEELSNFLIKKDDILFAMTGATVGKVFIYNFNMNSLLNQRVGLIRVNNNKLYYKFLLYFLYDKHFYNFCQGNSSGGAQQNISPKTVKTYKIPLPPLEIQEKIVKEIEGYEKIINGCKEVVDNWKPKFEIDEDWEKVELGEVVNYEQSTKYIVESTIYNNDYKTPVLTAGQTFILGYTNEENNIFRDNLPVIIFDDFTTDIKYVDFPFKVKSSAMKILHVNRNKANIKYIFNLMKNIKFNNSQHKRYWISEYSKVKIPLPPLEIQQEIVAKIEEEKTYIDGCKKLIETYQEKIKNVIDGVIGGEDGK